MDDKEREYIDNKDLIDFTEEDEEEVVLSPPPPDEERSTPLEEPPLPEVEDVDEPVQPLVEKARDLKRRYLRWVVVGVFLASLTAAAMILPALLKDEPTPVVQTGYTDPGGGTPSSSDVEEDGGTIADPPADTTELGAETLLLATQEVNRVMVEASQEDIAYVERYNTAQANRVGLESQLNRSLQKKQPALQSLRDQQARFLDSGMGSVYESTKRRAESSVAFTERLLLELNSGSKNFDLVIRAHRDEDQENREMQLETIRLSLNSLGVTYQESEGQIFID